MLDGVPMVRLADIHHQVCIRGKGVGYLAVSRQPTEFLVHIIWMNSFRLLLQVLRDKNTSALRRKVNSLGLPFREISERQRDLLIRYDPFSGEPNP